MGGRGVSVEVRGRGREGTGGREAQELKEGTHDEEEEPVRRNTHSYMNREQSGLCASGIEEEGGKGGRQGDGDPVTLKKFWDILLLLLFLLLHPLLLLFPVPCPPPQPPICRNVADADDVTLFLRSPSSLLVHGEGSE